MRRAPNKWLERTMLCVTSLAERQASDAPHRPPLSHTVISSRGYAKALHWWW